MIALDGIRCVDYPSYLRRKIEIGAQSVPVVGPALDDDGIMFGPAFRPPRT